MRQNDGQILKNFKFVRAGRNPLSFTAQVTNDPHSAMRPWVRFAKIWLHHRLMLCQCSRESTGDGVLKYVAVWKMSGVADDLLPDFSKPLSVPYKFTQNDTVPDDVGCERW